MTNEYLSCAKWDALQDAIAGALLPACDRNSADAQDAARDRAAILLADAGVMFEGSRSDFPEQAHVTISFNGLTTTTPIVLSGDLPRDKIDFAIRLAARDATESFLHSYQAA